MARFILLIVLLTFSATSANAAVLLGCCEGMKAAGAEKVKPCHEMSYQKSPSKTFSKSGFCPYLCVSQLAENMLVFSHVVAIASMDAHILSHDEMESVSISPPYPPPKI